MPSSYKRLVKIIGFDPLHKFTCCGWNETTGKPCTVVICPKRCHKSYVTLKTCASMPTTSPDLIESLKEAAKELLCVGPHLFQARIIAARWFEELDNAESQHAGTDESDDDWEPDEDDEEDDDDNSTTTSDASTSMSKKRGKRNKSQPAKRTPSTSTATTTQSDNPDLEALALVYESLAIAVATSHMTGDEKLSIFKAASDRRRLFHLKSEKADGLEKGWAAKVKATTEPEFGGGGGRGFCFGQTESVFASSGTQL